MSQNPILIDILPEHNLLRRYVHPNPPDRLMIKEDGTVCSTCYHLRPNEDGISVDIEHLTNYDKSVKDRTKFRLLWLNAGDVQNLGLNTNHNPLPDNEAHALITGDIDRKISKKLAYISRVVPLPD
ncbi:MAG: hypothetical protein RO257_07625 [Candidatus Kapabacteria bacterium]|nr:hypothetical protein [Candidatus Kapabacteria bacterium]